LVPIDFSYTTSYRFSIVTFALGRTVWPQYITSRTDRQTDRQQTLRRNTVPIARHTIRFNTTRLLMFRPMLRVMITYCFERCSLVRVL